MSRMLKKSLLLTTILMLGLSTVGQADWFHFANNVRIPDGNPKHDTDLLQMSVVATDVESAWACVRYARESDKAKKGKVKTTARFMFDGEVVGTLNFSQGVSQDRVLFCKEGPEALIGTVVEFEHEFVGMPRVLGKKGQFVAVSGIVGATELESSVVFDTGSITLKSADEDASGRIAGASSLFVADKDSQKHPTSLSQTAITTRDLTAAVACTSYRRNSDRNRSQGKFTSKATVIYPDGETEILNFSSGVSKDEAISCRELSRDAPIGTVIENDIEFKGMPKVKDVEGAPENFVVNTSLSTAGETDFRLPPAPVVNNPGGTGGGNPPPTNTGALSAADQACISRVLYAAGSNARQIVRPRGNAGGKFEVFGPNSLVDATFHPIVSTLGFGSTYAAACADYERKRGNMPAGPNLPAADVALWVWYSNMNSAAGPTAVRRDPRGGYHGDCFRAGKGAVIFNVSSPAAALRALQGAGL